MASNFDTPILFTIYNRPRHTQQVFNRIRDLRPRRLFIAADGPSNRKLADVEKCEKARAVVKNIDWECEVHTLFADANQGCRKAMSGNIDWFFSKVEEGIILEDDCLPHPSFFPFCRELLAFYRHDERVMLICGDNKCNHTRSDDGSYYFSRLVHIWGWATWRRAWAHYDVNLAGFPLFKDQRQIRNLFSNPALQRFWIRHFKEVYNGGVDTWDYQWVYTVFSRGALSIMPRVNLVSNIGCDAEGTHTTSRSQTDALLQTSDTGALVHPRFVIPDNEADERVARKYYGLNMQKKRFSFNSFSRGARQFLRSVFPLRVKAG